VIFFSDLDGTVIFSKRKICGECVCVEKKDGKEMSFMTMREAELFGHITEKAAFIPVTTRSIEQYGRIRFPGGYKPKYAVTENGAVLLIDGVPDREWSRRSRRAAAECREELEQCKIILERIAGNEYKVRYCDGLFIYIKYPDCGYLAEKLLSGFAPQKVSVYNSGGKLYVIPKKINKSSALRRVKEMLSAESAAAAGDSELDRDFLAAADIAVIKQGTLSGSRINKNQICEDIPDNDFVFKAVLQIIEQEQ